MLKNAPKTFCINLHICTRAPCRTGGFRHAGKLKLLNNAYIPISLLPVLGKVMEKIILQRIKWSAEPPSTRATGFKAGSPARLMQSVFCFTIYQVSEPEDDGEQSSIWTYRKLHGRMLTWISDFLTGRSAIVRFQNFTSNDQSFENGTPKGSSLGPTLFNYAMNIFIRLELQRWFES